MTIGNRLGNECRIVSFVLPFGWENPLDACETCSCLLLLLCGNLQVSVLMIQVKHHNLSILPCSDKTVVLLNQFLCQGTLFFKTIKYTYFVCFCCTVIYLASPSSKTCFPFPEVENKQCNVLSLVRTSALSPTDGSLWACHTCFTFFTLRGCCWGVSLM